LKTKQSNKQGAEVAKETTVLNRRRQRRKGPPPGIYRVRVERCEAVMYPRDRREVSFDFKVEAPDRALGRPMKLSLRTGEPGVADYLCRVFAVAGVALTDEGDLPIACREVVGRYLYVEVLMDGELHLQQLAATYMIAVPALVPFPSAPKARRPAPSPTRKPRPSDPFYPRF
jgi:hypothetical protein